MARKYIFLIVTLAWPPSLHAQWNALVVYGDSVNAALCTAAYFLDAVREKADQLVRAGADPMQAAGHTAASMSAVLDVLLPRIEVALTRMRLVESPDTPMEVRDSMTIPLTRSYDVLRQTAERIDYRKNSLVSCLDPSR